jgi:hypothetical protein
VSIIDPSECGQTHERLTAGRRLALRASLRPRNFGLAWQPTFIRCLLLKEYTRKEGTNTVRHPGHAVQREPGTALLTESTPLYTFSLPGFRLLHRPLPYCAAPLTTSDMATWSAANFRNQQLGNTEPHLITAASCPVLHHATPALILPASSSTIGGRTANQFCQQAPQHQVASLNIGCLLTTDAQSILAYLPILYDLYTL